mgnify:CR=1 FL=1
MKKKDIILYKLENTGNCFVYSARKDAKKGELTGKIDDTS